MNPLQPRRMQFVAEIKARQVAKIQEIGDILASAGIRTLDAQAKALGLSRSTTWIIVTGRYKASGLSAKTINRILTQPQLSPLVRAKILEYVDEKIAGCYGHGKQPRHRFGAQLSLGQRIRGHWE